MDKLIFTPFETKKIDDLYDFIEAKIKTFNSYAELVNLFELAVNHVNMHNCFTVADDSHCYEILAEVAEYFVCSDLNMDRERVARDFEAHLPEGFKIVTYVNDNRYTIPCVFEIKAA
jgi:hypothetical protein